MGLRGFDSCRATNNKYVYYIVMHSKFMEPDDYHVAPVSKILRFIQSV
jgi:hypothetical protein